jgi:hypothetical protein
MDLPHGDSGVGRALATTDAIAVGGLAIMIVCVTHYLRPSIVDDAFIYWRVVDNIASGFGWVFNPGEHVNPCSSPLFTGLLLLSRLLRLDGPDALLIAYGTGLLAAGLMQYAAFRNESRAVALVMAVVTSTEAVLLHSAGLETSVFLACVLGTALAVQKGRGDLAAIGAGLTALSRLDGLAMILVVLLDRGLRVRRSPLRGLLICIAVLCPWLVFSWHTFGAILPQSVAVKAVQSGIGWWAQQRPWWIAFLAQQRLPVLTLPLACVGMACGYRAYCAGRPYMLIVVAFGLTQVIGYSVLRAPVGYYWYFAPGNLAVNMAVVAGLFRIAPPVTAMISRHRENWLKRARRIPVPLARIAPAVGAILLMTQAGAAPAKPIRPYRLAQEYSDAGRWIATHTDAEVRVACTEIGYIGFYSRRYIRDIHGLLHPDALDDIRAQRWSWWFDRDPPQIIVAHRSPWAGEPSVEWPTPGSFERFRRAYHRVFQSGEVVVYQKAPAPADAAHPFDLSGGLTDHAP